MRIDKFCQWLASIDTTSVGCWEWPAAKSTLGYGHVCLEGRRLLAHRAAWIVTHGRIPARVSVCHRCDNPKCFRPSHLFLGSQRANARDMAVKARWKNQHGGTGAVPRAVQSVALPELPLELRRIDFIQWIGQQEIGDSCWLFPSVTGYGYGRGTMNGRRGHTHKFAYEMFVGPVPAGLHIDHLCGNRACCNPAHLDAVTQQENNRRRDARIVVCPRGHTLGGDNVRPHTKNGCRACWISYQTEYRRRPDALARRRDLQRNERRTNSEKLRARKRRYYERHKEQIAAYGKARWSSNRERLQAQVRAYYRSHREQILESLKEKRRQRKRAAAH